MKVLVVLVVILLVLFTKVSYGKVGKLSPVTLSQYKVKESSWYPAYHSLVNKYSKHFKVPAERIMATIFVESHGDPDVKSTASCYGLMQLMPSTARWLKCLGEAPTGLKEESISSTLDLNAVLYDPEVNIRCGTQYLKYLYDELKNWDRVHWAYNYGPGAVRKMRRRGVKSSKIRYVKKINYSLKLYKGKK